ncbi:FUSC family protein [Dyella sp. EPa41]|uniref:FUSC family protein n=1 Tax=Dyella sp. EPa41 TaxID=1561194 RepID=UPI001915F8AF|nr:FUSC family protein [Dyella sp. EPa41]
MSIVDPARSRSPGADRPAWLRAWIEAAATLLAALATLLCAWAISPGPGGAVLAVVLALSLSRSQLDRDRRGRLEAALVLPLVAFAALGVGWLLRYWPWIGAAFFVVGMFLSIWLRRFGPMAGRAGSLIALPFVTLLTMPHVHATSGGLLPPVLVPMVIALLALLWVDVFHRLTKRWRWQGPAQSATLPAAREGSPRMAASTRMALQMAASLAVAFVIGFVFFSEHWAWIVLTAFIVNSGNRGRLDVLYKSGMRVAGAAAGTAIALLLSVHLGWDGRTTGALILAALFMGVWLRPFAYAWWALFVTVALALLQGFDGGTPAAMLWQRMGEIVLGAVIGVSAAWFVLPVRSTDVLRRRLADALAALAEAVDPATAARNATPFDEACDLVAQVVPPFRAVRWLTRRTHAMQPADWADTLLACRPTAVVLIGRGATPGALRQAIGAARKALREPAKLLPALQHLRKRLHECVLEAEREPLAPIDAAMTTRPSTRDA